MGYQQTIIKEISFSGIGIHSGEEVTICLKPAPVNNGIVFIRKDLPSSPVIPAIVDNVSSTLRGTTLSSDGVEIKTVEHILSCLSGLCIDNLFIEVYGPEIPIMDGSSYPFVQAIISSGIKEQSDGERNFIIPYETVWVLDKDSYLILLPYDHFKITYIIDYNHSLLKTQMEEILIEPRTYTNFISQARTYGFIEEIQYLLDNNLALGGSLDNALVIKKDGYSSPLRYPNEPVRHKILDLIGDLSLLGAYLKGHIIAIKSSHKLNIEFAKIIKTRFMKTSQPFSEKFLASLVDINCIKI